MNTKLLSEPALDTINQYLHFKIGAAECAVPYFNNRHMAKRASLRAAAGKGSPREIFDEVEILAARQNRGGNENKWTGDSLKKFMCDEDVGIDCSGLAYYILAAENKARGKGALDRHLSFPSAGFFRGFITKLRPIENADVTVFAHPKNSITIDLTKIAPGDFIAMIGGSTPPDTSSLRAVPGLPVPSTRPEGSSRSSPREVSAGVPNRNHILVVHAVDYQNFVPIAIHYTNSIAWPDDGLYDHGVRRGTIEIIAPDKNILEQKWTEKGKTGTENGTFTRAKNSRTEIRRLKWWGNSN